jgi:hypothetical protein
MIAMPTKPTTKAPQRRMPIFSRNMTTAPRDVNSTTVKLSAVASPTGTRDRV